MAPVVEGSSPFTHPNAPVAQLDRASDFESAGRPFEPDRARQKPEGLLIRDEINSQRLMCAFVVLGNLRGIPSNFGSR